MLVLKVRVNNEAPILAGADDLGVLNAVVSCVGKLGPATEPLREDEGVEMSLKLGGLTSRAGGVADQHLDWMAHKSLEIGDVISVEVLDATMADAPVGGKEAVRKASDERDYFEHCKRNYLALKDKYER